MMRNGDAQFAYPRMPPAPHFHSTVSVQKLKRFNNFVLVLRSGAFCFALAASIFMLTNTSSSSAGSPRWYDFNAFRFVVIANAIVALYSLLEMGASVWEIFRGGTLFPEIFHVWFDFGHDQVFAYLLLSANSTGIQLVRMLKQLDTCKAVNSVCVQSEIAIGLGFIAFVFIVFSSLLSGYRVVCFIINGSRFHM